MILFKLLIKVNSYILHVQMNVKGESSTKWIKLKPRTRAESDSRGVEGLSFPGFQELLSDMFSWEAWLLLVLLCSFVAYVLLSKCSRDISCECFFLIKRGIPKFEFEMISLVSSDSAASN